MGPSEKRRSWLDIVCNINFPMQYCRTHILHLIYNILRACRDIQEMCTCRERAKKENWFTKKLIERISNLEKRIKKRIAYHYQLYKGHKQQGKMSGWLGMRKGKQCNERGWIWLTQKQTQSDTKEEVMCLPLLPQHQLATSSLCWKCCNLPNSILCTHHHHHRRQPFGKQFLWIFSLSRDYE